MMIMMTKRIFLYSVLLLALSGCSDFLREQSQDLTYATSCKDLSELLIGNGYMGIPENYSNFSGNNGPYMPWIHVMDDDTRELHWGFPGGNPALSFQKLASFHRWEKHPFQEGGAPYTDPNWARFYTHISILNVILEKVKEFPDNPIEEQMRVKGESHFLRGAYYFLLINTYARAYDATTAESDPGVPLKLSSHVEDRPFERATVAEVYRQVEADLLQAVACLEGLKSESVYRASEAAALTLLGRLYCYMGRWEEVPELCDRVIRKGYRLLDLNTHDPGKDSFTHRDSPETIFSMGGNCWPQISERPKIPVRATHTFTLSEEMQYRLYDETDLRPAAFFYFSASVEDPYLQPLKFDESKNRGKTVSDLFLFRIAEVYLNKAEALAMNGSEAEAVTTLQELRKNRFAPEQLTALPLSGDELVRFIRDERRRELCFEGHRWFDLRRYAVSPKYPFEKEIRHDHYDSDPTANPASRQPGIITGYYLLEYYSREAGRFVMPLPDSEIEMNEGALVNNERPETPLTNL